MGPGPIDADPRVLQAMSSQLIGQFDPSMTACMDLTMASYREVFCTDNQWTFLVDSTSRGAIEASMVSLVEPGDTVLVPIFGRFGYLLKEIASRCGANVETIEVPWGTVFDPQQIADAIRETQPKVLAIVQGDTSTTMLQPLADIGALCREAGVILYCDATASIGGNALQTDDWGLEVVTVGLQKCLGGPSGSAPITLGEHAVDVIKARRHVEAGIKTQDHREGNGLRIASNYFDLAMIMDYWGPERLNHHTEATSMLYGSLECARILLEEGLDNAIARHELNGRALAEGLLAMNLQLYGDQQNRMNNVVGVYIPVQVNGALVRHDMLHDYGIEIGTSFGPLDGVIWRIGTMGYNARPDAVLKTLACLEQCLISSQHGMQPGAAVAAAKKTYAAAQTS
ncbi:MAG: alanine--glyoxylate aminotransferase family protein [OM182 bacterium]|nr:MAG: alanine--glyoxylate aminotransferase family protein [OM182 bacterium]